MVNQTTFRQLCNGRFPPNLVTKRISVSRCGIRTFSKILTLGVICPQNRHLTAGYRSWDALQRDTVTPCCSPRHREFPISSQLFSTTYSCGAMGRQIAQFSDFGLFSPHKTLKTYLPVISLQPRGYIAE